MRVSHLWDLARARADRRRPNSRLAVIGDGTGWSLDHDADELIRVVQHWGGHASASPSPWPNQPAFFASRLAALRGVDRWRRMGVSICCSYFHGYPGEGDATFDETYDLFRRHHDRLARVQVTHSRMHELLLEAGVAREKLRTIRIGVNSALFVIPTIEQRRSVRERLGIPQTAVVVGSFQKDGDGWGSGLEPKGIKGPDVLVKSLTILQSTLPELFVLLCGPARGYVRRGLEAAGIPYAHTLVAGHRDVPALFHALDAYVVASRQEGGPKAILESMASGVPIVSTRVGQAPDLIRHRENGGLGDVGDAEALAEFTRAALEPESRRLCQQNARLTAEENDYLSQIPQWRDFFQGLLLEYGRSGGERH